MKDQEEEYTLNRNLIEYHASFIDPEMVSKIIEQRESNKNNVIGTTDDEEFSKSVGKIFGRDPKLGPRKDTGSNDVHEVSDILDRIEAYEKEQASKNRNILPYNYSHWSEFDLEK